MRRILIIGAGEHTVGLLPVIFSAANTEIIAVTDKSEDAKAFSLAKKLKIQTSTEWKQWINEGIDLVIEMTGDRNVLDEIIKLCNEKTEVIPHSIAFIFSDFIAENKEYLKPDSKDILEIKALANELHQAKTLIRRLEEKYTFDDIAGSSHEIQLAVEQAKIAAKTSFSILLRGAEGTGKDLFARAIHNESDRKLQKIIRINCKGIDEDELFGCEQSSSSDLEQTSVKGMLEEANDGTVFLNEITELAPNLQQKLLHLIKKREIIRSGGKKPVQVNVRIIAASTVSLEKAMINGLFNAELYDQLNRLPIYIPALHERITDMPALLRHFIEKLNKKLGKNVRSVSSEALTVLTDYHWPGNLNELENIIERAMIYMEQDESIINKKHLPELAHPADKENTPDVMFSYKEPLHTVIDKFEKDYIYEVYKRNGYNKTKTAKVLKISIRNLYYKMEKYKLK